jgi:hypothetical protein
MTDARSWASGSRSTSLSVLIGAGGQATGPMVMAGNLSHAHRCSSYGQVRCKVAN